MNSCRCTHVPPHTQLDPSQQPPTNNAMSTHTHARTHTRTRAGGLVQQEDLAVPEERSSHAQQLPLPEAVWGWFCGGVVGGPSHGSVRC